MRIAIVSAPFGQTGGPELTATQLADALAEKGVDVSLFAPADFTTKARLVPTLNQSLLQMKDLKDMSTFEKRNLVISSQIKVINHQDEFDLIHISSQRYGYAVAKNLHKPRVITLHNRMSARDYSFLKETGVAAIALTEKYMKELNAEAFAYPGIPLRQIEPSFKKGSGLITIGRITDQKGIHVAIEIAKRANKKLTIVGRIGNSKERQAYFDQYVGPHIGDLVTFINEIHNQDLLKLVAGSEALLFPITRPETFGRVVAEALSCGTPVIGSETDPLPELLADSRVCALSNDVSALAEAAQNTDRFDRESCREYAEKFFDIEVAAENHIEIYEKIIGSY